MSAAAQPNLTRTVYQEASLGEASLSQPILCGATKFVSGYTFQAEAMAVPNLSMVLMHRRRVPYSTGSSNVHETSSNIMVSLSRDPGGSQSGGDDRGTEDGEGPQYGAHGYN